MKKKQIKTRIAGIQHHRGSAEALGPMRAQTRLVLKPDPKNPVDKNAIRIYTTSGLMLGYIPAVDCELVLSRLNDPNVRVQCLKTSDTFNSIVLILEITDDLGDPLA